MTLFFKNYSSQNEFSISKKMFQSKLITNNLKYYDVVTEPEFEFVFTSKNDTCILCDELLFARCKKCKYNECPKMRCR